MEDLQEPFSSLQGPLKSAILATTRTSAALAAEDIPFQRSISPSFAATLDRQNARILSLSERLLAATVADGTQIVSKGASGAARITPPRLQDADALERNWSGVVDVIDSLLERTDGVLDELRGLIRKGKNEGLGAEKVEKPVAMPRLTGKGWPQAANILKPQRGFDVPPDNFATGPWKPILTSKPHAQVPLEQSLRTEIGPDGSPRYALPKFDTPQFQAALEHQYNAAFYLINYSHCTQDMKARIDSYIRFRHPYQAEIEAYRYPPSVYAKTEPIPYLPYESTTATLVDTEEAMFRMLKELKEAKELAIDLEHHDQRTFLGVVCLMQISTRDKDWVIDTLKPWRRKLECLNEVFTNPDIVKVLHGSTMDVVWLQRDLGLYLNGVFDTEHAATALHYPKRSLAFLLDKFTGFQAQKQYQLADWRVRPLPKEMFEYARSDTHFLLYVFDNMRNQLIDKSSLDTPDGDLIDRVLRESKRYQLQRYENPIYDAENGLGTGGWYKTLFRTPSLLSKQQFSVFKAVHQWRDSMARKKDESVFSVMNNHQLMTIAREMPTKTEDVLAMVPGSARIVREAAKDLCAVISEAKDAGLVGPEMRDALAKVDLIADERHNVNVAAKAAIAQALRTNVSPQPAIVTEAAEAGGVPPSDIPFDVADVKTSRSGFWGSTLGSASQKRYMHSDVRMTLPMPVVEAEVFAQNGPKLDSATSPEAVPVVRENGAQSESNSHDADVFTLRDMKKEKTKSKREQKARADPVTHDLQAGLDEISGISNAEHARLKQQKRERRAAKTEKKETAQERATTNATGFLSALMKPSATSSSATSDPVPETNATSSSSAGHQVAEAPEEEPFDYANAPSVLNGGAPDSSSSKRKKERKKDRMKGFDPYKKALDAPKGLPRAQKERIGRAATFGAGK